MTNVDVTFLSATTTVYSPSVVLLVAVPLVSSTTVYTPARVDTELGSPTFITSTVAVYSPQVGVVTLPSGSADPQYVVQIRDLDGTDPTTLSLVKAYEIQWTLNEPTTARIGWPKYAYTAAQIPTLGDSSGPRKMQIYHDDALLFSGPLIQTSVDGSDGEVEGDCADMLWLMNRRLIDSPRDNFLTNADFESGFTGWTKSGTFTDTADTARKVLGTQSAKFVNTTTEGDEFYYQAFTAGPNGVGLLLTCVGWFYVETFTDRALGARGIFMEGSRDGVLQDYDFWPIDLGTEFQQWVRAEFQLHVPPNQTWDMNVRLYAINGTVFYDALQVVAMESIGTANLTGSVTSEADIARIAQLLVAQIQDTNHGKSNLYVGASCPDNGVKVVRHYQYADHTPFGDAIAEFTDRDDGFDISIESTPTTESFHTHTPNKGTDRSASVTLTFGGNVADYRWSLDGSGTVTRATILGQGDGPDREEGEYDDTSQLGGLIMQAVRTAPQGATINSLIPLARDAVKKRRVPPLLLELDILSSANLIHTLEVGDRVDVDINDGFVNVQGTYRIVRLRLDCETSVLTATINEEAD